MPQQIERRRAERRHADPRAEDELSPEYLALLEVCGGEIRASDKAALAERRRATETLPTLEKTDDGGDAQVAPAADRRRPGAIGA